MSESAKKSASIQVFNSFSNAEIWINEHQSNRYLATPRRLPDFGEDIDTTPLQKIVSILERGVLGSVYLTESAAPVSSNQMNSLLAATPALGQEPVFDTLTQADFDLDQTQTLDLEQTIHNQYWELWVSQQASGTLPSTTDTSSTGNTSSDQTEDKAQNESELSQQLDDEALIFKLREVRASQWNELLHPDAHFTQLSPAEELSILTPEVYLEDTLTLSDHQSGIVSIKSSIEQERLRKMNTPPTSPSTTEQVDRNVANDNVVTQPSGERSGYLVRYASVPFRPLPFKKLAQLHPYSLIKSSSIVNQSSMQNADSQSDIPDLASKPVKTLPISKIRDVIDSMRPLFDLINDIHKSGYCLGGFDPSLFKAISLQKNATGDELSPTHVRPVYPLRLYHLQRPSSEELGDLSVADDLFEPQIQLASSPYIRGEELSVYLGYSPPEMYGYYQGVPSTKSDVFSAAMMIYYAITDCPRFAETMRPFARLPSPVVYRQDLPPELIAVVYRAISPSPARRHQDMEAFMRELEWALHTAELREQISPSSLQLEAGHEIHIGILKGQYNPINQDDLFLGYQSDNDLGLFVVTDGVSICEHGSGDLASGLVREEAAKSWRNLCQMRSIGDEEETLSELNLSALEGQTYNYGRVLTSLINNANRRIGEYINQRVPVFHGPPEGIMAATVVAAAITRGVVMLTSVGDSRIYLIREGHITSLMYDEDLYTHLLQARQSPAQAQQSPSAAALVHCVGEFNKDSDQKLQASLISPQLREVKLLPGDQLVLCSDGIPDYSGVDEEDAEECILRCVESALTVHHAAFELISLANRGGGGDNLSCIVLKFSEGKDFLRGEL
jgi:serine/threonine protein phosphatase PrpC